MYYMPILFKTSTLYTLCGVTQFVMITWEENCVSGLEALRWKLVTWISRPYPSHSLKGCCEDARDVRGMRMMS